MSELRTSNKTLEYPLGHFNFTVSGTQKSIYFIRQDHGFTSAVKNLLKQPEILHDFHSKLSVMSAICVTTSL
jgi:hypothetical protein